MSENNGGVEKSDYGPEFDIASEELEGGALYVVVEVGGKKQLRRIPRDENDLPKVRIYDEELSKAKALQGGMRKVTGGYRPPIEVIISAGVDLLNSSPKPHELILRFNLARVAESLPENRPAD